MAFRARGNFSNRFWQLYPTFPGDPDSNFPRNQFVAEREGFEPPEPFSSTVFKTAVIDHSTTSPICRSIS